jgi:hypothetical protein
MKNAFYVLFLLVTIAVTYIVLSLISMNQAAPIVEPGVVQVFEGGVPTQAAVYNPQGSSQKLQGN